MDAMRKNSEFSNMDDLFMHVSEEITGVSEGTPALAWAVIGNGEIAHFSSAGEIKLGGGQRPGINSVFRIASLSKSFAAATALLLEHQGLLDIEAPVTRYLPGLVVQGPPARLPTLRDVLSMAAGFPSDDAWADRQESMTSEDFDTLLAEGAVRTEAPGQSFQYSNLGYAMVGRIIENVTGQPYPEVVNRLLFAPLGLHSITYDYHDVPCRSLARGYRISGQKWLLQEPTAPGAFSAIGGAFSTVSDMAKWVGTLAAATSSCADGGPLPAGLRRRMQRPVTQVPFTVDPSTGLPRSRGFPWGLSAYGLGLFIEQDPDFGPITHHVGGYPGYGAHMCWHQASGTGVVAFGGSTYAPLSAPAIHGLKSLLKQRSGRASAPRGLDAIVTAVKSFIFQGEVTAGVYSPCVPLDRPWQERRRELTSLKTQVGPLASEACQVAVVNNAHLSVRLPGTRGSLTAEIRLTPVHPRQVQVLDFKAEAATRHSTGPPKHGRAQVDLACLDP